MSNIIRSIFLNSHSHVVRGKRSNFLTATCYCVLCGNKDFVEFDLSKDTLPSCSEEGFRLVCDKCAYHMEGNLDEEV